MTGRSEGPPGNGPSPNCVMGFYKQQATGIAFDTPSGIGDIKHEE